MSTLRLDSVSRHFGALAAVDELELHLGTGEICGLVGPNGSGKTTLLNCISGVLPLTDGTVHYLGEDVTKLEAHEMAWRSMRRTFQLSRLVDTATAIENVLMGLYTSASDRRIHRALLSFTVRRERQRLQERALDALERCGVSNFAKDIVGELSFGVQRRVELARAIVAEPRMLLLDEPAAGVTSADMESLKQIVRDQAAGGCTVLLVDHHLSFVLDLCPRLVVMNFGRKIFDGPSTSAVEDVAVREAYVGA